MDMVKKAGGIVVKMHGDDLSAGQPDLIGALNKVPFAIEWKKSEKEQPTELQKSILSLWQKNGVHTSVQWNAQQAWNWLMDRSVLWVSTGKFN
jgi:hypothetical protein